VQGEGDLPPLKRSGKGVRAAQAERGSLGKPLAGARGERPLAAFAVAVAFQAIRAGVAGRNRPAEVGGGGRAFAAADREDTSSHQRTAFVGKNQNCE
jgi:hypothetical protein